MNKHWADLVEEKRALHGDFVLGIDPVFGDIPDVFKQDSLSAPEAVRKYVGFLLDVLSGQIGFVKFQSAFFEALGSKGVGVLADGIAKARRKGLGVILDAKRGDVSGTATAYAQAYLTPAALNSCSDLEVDCLTINPFLGPETMEPFVDCARKFGKGLFVLTKTSNPGAGWLQDKASGGKPISDYIADLVAKWAAETEGTSGLGAVGAVVGTTYPQDGKRLRALMPSSIFLCTGVGPQGGKSDDIDGLRRTDKRGVLVPVQRGVTKVDDLVLSLDQYAALVCERVTTYQRLLST